MIIACVNEGGSFDLSRASQEKKRMNFRRDNIKSFFHRQTSQKEREKKEKLLTRLKSEEYDHQPLSQNTLVSFNKDIPRISMKFLDLDFDEIVIC